MRKVLLIVAVFSFLTADIIGQEDQDSVIQFSGRVVANVDNNLEPLPYTTIGIVGTSRGSTADLDGFFSFVAVKGRHI